MSLSSSASYPLYNWRPLPTRFMHELRYIPHAIYGHPNLCFPIRHSVRMRPLYYVKPSRHDGVYSAPERCADSLSLTVHARKLCPGWGYGGYVRPLSTPPAPRACPSNNARLTLFGCNRTPVAHTPIVHSPITMSRFCACISVVLS